MDRTTTAWKKNRKFGDVYGGRERPKFADNIFKRCHSLQRPAEGQALPILLQDNPSRNFFFPIDVHEAAESLKALPKKDHDGITHIWCRRLKQTEFNRGARPLAAFICGSGVRVVVLYSWPTSMELFWNYKPSNRFLNEARRFGFQVTKIKKGWTVKPTLAQLRRYYIQNLLYHEVGHHVDWYTRHWTPANNKQVEDYADQYAIQKTATATHVFNRLNKTRLAENGTEH